MRLLFFVLVAAFLSMTGCTLTKKEVPLGEFSRGEIANAPGDAEILLQYAVYLRRLSSGEIIREQEVLRQNMVKSKTELNRAQLAMIYALPGLPLHDDGKALAILEPLSKEAVSPAVRNFSLLLQSFVVDNKRLDEGAQVLNSKLKDEQKQSAELQQKLEALKSIEKSLSERDRGKQPAANRL
jgi:hypothetical protein